MMLRNINYVARFISVADEKDKSTVKGFRFEILYFGDLVLTDGVVYDDFEKCAKAFSAYIISLYHHKSFYPMVVNF